MRRSRLDRHANAPPIAAARVRFESLIHFAISVALSRKSGPNSADFRATRERGESRLEDAPRSTYTRSLSL